MDRLISEQAVFKIIDSLKANFTCYDSVTLDEVAFHVKAIPSADEDEWVKRSDVIRVIDKRVDERLSEPKWIPVSERLPEEDGDYFATYEKGYAEDYNLTPIGIVRFEADCESFGYWHEYFDGQTMGSLGSEWEEIKVIAWMPLPKPYEPQESEGKENGNK